jgi:hypothetical protein
VFFFKKWSEAEDWYVAERVTKENLGRKCTELQYAFDKNYSDLTIMHNENNSIFYLQSADSTKRYSGRVYWNRYTHQTYLDIQSLPPAPAEKRYQLWAYLGETPIDAGVIVLRDDRTLIPMKNIDKAEKWVITLESSGGGLAPRLDSSLFLISNN